MSFSKSAMLLSALALASATAHAQSTQPRRPATLALTAASGNDLRAWSAAIDSMSRNGELALRRSDRDLLVPSRTHERLDQYYKGVRVYGGDVARQLDAGVTVSIFGNVYQGIDLDVAPALSVEEAAAVVKRDSGVDLGPAKMPQLLVLPEDDGFRLVYHATAFSMSGGFEYFLDARSGDIVIKRDAVKRQAAVGTGMGVVGDTKKVSTLQGSSRYTTDDQLRPPQLITFDMKGDVRRTIDFLNGVIGLTANDVAADSDNTWTDTAVVDAHVYAGYTYDYYYKRFGRRGLDNDNLRILSLVHPAYRSNLFLYPSDIQDAFYTNAGYYGDGVMLYGEGLPSTITIGGQTWDYLAGSLDIIAHELTHGVTDYTSGLIYFGESGALNESFSDMMGAAVEFYYQPAGSGLLRADYLMGEDAIRPGGIRSMSNPAAFGDPDHYSRRYLGPEDNGGVHINSSIGNQAFYLAIEGGTNRTSGLTVTGVGAANREQIERVMYRAFTQMLPANASYSVARAATIQAARDLYGAGSAAERAVTQAWTAVGVN